MEFKDVDRPVADDLVKRGRPWGSNTLIAAIRRTADTGRVVAVPVNGKPARKVARGMGGTLRTRLGREGLRMYLRTAADEQTVYVWAERKASAL